MSQRIQTSQDASHAQCSQADFYRLPAASDETHYRLFQFGAGENHVQLLIPPAKRVTVSSVIVAIIPSCNSCC